MKQRHLIASIGMFGVLVINALAIFSVIVVQMAPLEWWVEWIDIYPAKKHFEVGEGLRFISHVNVKHDVDAEYNDIVRCKNGGVGEVYIYHGAQASAHFNLKKSDGPYEAPWKHNSILLHPDECFLESNIKITIFPGVIKYYTHRSEPFFIIPAKNK